MLRLVAVGRADPPCFPDGAGRGAGGEAAQARVARRADGRLRDLGERRERAVADAARAGAGLAHRAELAPAVARPGLAAARPADVLPDPARPPVRGRARLLP